MLSVLTLSTAELHRQGRFTQLTRTNRDIAIVKCVCDGLAVCAFMMMGIGLDPYFGLVRLH